ncbi:MAG: hypothetical protein KAR12_02195, partial [Methylococcales bacterium]|nr:hypothetical protein [Methylococcales bacterium]
NCRGAVTEKYVFIKQHQKAHRIQKMCQTLSVSRSAYYDWLNRPESNRSKKNRQLETKIKCFHQISKGIYGSLNKSSINIPQQLT